MNTPSLAIIIPILEIIFSIRGDVGDGRQAVYIGTRACYSSRMACP